jgi:hypothetical protein
MYSITAALAVLLALASANFLEQPTGLVRVTRLLNGTEIHENLLDPNSTPFIQHLENGVLNPALPIFGSSVSATADSPNAVSKRGASCWGYFLDSFDVDSAVITLKEYLSDPNTGGGEYLGQYALSYHNFASNTANYTQTTVYLRLL